MIIDQLGNAGLYYGIHSRIADAFAYLQTTDLAAIAPGKYVINGADLFAIVQEYETMDAVNEQMESHRKYIDVQYMIAGEEQVGHAMLCGQTVSKQYDEDTDFMLYADVPSFFTKLSAGRFMVFFPTDLHMPCITSGEKALVKKVVIKMKV